MQYWVGQAQKSKLSKLKLGSYLDGTEASVDLALVQANLPGSLSHFFAGFRVNASVHALASREPVVGRCDQHVAVMLPWIATDHAKDAMPASSRHVEFGHGRPKRHEYI